MEKVKRNIDSKETFLFGDFNKNKVYTILIPRSKEIFWLVNMATRLPG
jgi:hypothetical protein